MAEGQPIGQIERGENSPVGVLLTGDPCPSTSAPSCANARPAHSLLPIRVGNPPIHTESNMSQNGGQGGPKGSSSGKGQQPAPGRNNSNDGGNGGAGKGDAKDGKSANSGSSGGSSGRAK